MHTKSKDKPVQCEVYLDEWGDHTVICGCGAHLFVRHTALNHILVEAGRAAGYTAFCEQVVPELCQVKENDEGNMKIMEARINVELFGHPYAPTHLLDGTIRYPGAASHVVHAAREIGYTAEEGVQAKFFLFYKPRIHNIPPCFKNTNYISTTLVNGLKVKHQY